jgi:hypothetical protein
MKFFAVAFIMLITTLRVISQDVIILKDSGDRIQAKVIEVGENDVKYKKFDNQEGPIYTISKAEIDMILYVNGSKDVFIEEPDKTDSTATKTTINENKANTSTPLNTENTVKPSTLTVDDLFRQGQKDASIYYRGYLNAASSTFLVSMIASPIGGLIPAFACSLTTPHGRSLMCPNKELIHNNDYYAGYILRAKKIKITRVWLSWGAACGIWSLLFLMSYN